MKLKQLFIIFALLALVVSGCGVTPGDEPAASDDQPVGGEVEPTQDPNEPVSSDDPLPTEEPTAEPGEMIIGEATVESIEVLILESFPVQVHVRVSGYLGDGCTELGDINVERVDDTFNVTIQTQRPADAICTQQLVGFEETIPLDVQGLEAGTYTVDVNGVTETFTLDVDNVPVEDPINEGTADWSMLAEEDQAELVRLTLERALLDQEIPDFLLLAEGKDEIVLSTENVDPELVPELEGVNLVLLSPEEIQAKANEEGDFLYLRFQMVDIQSETEATVSLANNWAVAENSDMAYLSGGGFTIEYTKSADGWTGEVTELWIS